MWRAFSNIRGPEDSVVFETLDSGWSAIEQSANFSTGATY